MPPTRRQSTIRPLRTTPRRSRFDALPPNQHQPVLTQLLLDPNLQRSVRHQFRGRNDLLAWVCAFNQTLTVQDLLSRLPEEEEYVRNVESVVVANDFLRQFAVTQLLELGAHRRLSSLDVSDLRGRYQALERRSPLSDNSDESDDPLDPVLEGDRVLRRIRYQAILGFPCHRCGQTGHSSRNCPEPESISGYLRVPRPASSNSSPPPLIPRTDSPQSNHSHQSSDAPPVPPPRQPTPIPTTNGISHSSRTVIDLRTPSPPPPHCSNCDRHGHHTRNCIYPPLPPSPRAREMAMRISGIIPNTVPVELVRSFDPEDYAEADVQYEALMASARGYEDPRPDPNDTWDATRGHHMA